MNDTNNNTETRTTDMETNTLLTGLQELFTNAVKAEVADVFAHSGDAPKLALDKDKLHEAVADALSEQDSDTYPCMDDVTRMVEGNFDEWFNNCMSDFDITDHVAVDELVSEAVNGIDLSEAINDTMYNNDIPNESRVEEMISESTSSGMSLSSANEMLRQVARGGDCEEGDSFREAVTSIVTAMQADTGGSVDDGTAMSVKVTGTEREIQAILQRRRSYFESLHNALAALMGSAPNGEVPPIDDDGRMTAWTERAAGRNPVSSPEVVANRLWAVAEASTELLGLLSGLYHGMTGAESLRAAHAWKDVLANYKGKATQEQA